MSVHILSFGYLHSTPPTTDLTVDVRRYPRDPARVGDAGLLDSTGLDRRVREMVRTTRGTDVVLLTMRMFVLGVVNDGKPVTVAIGCAGGRHRSVALAELLADELVTSYGLYVTVRHVDIGKPRVQRADESGPHF